MLGAPEFQKLGARLASKYKNLISTPVVSSGLMFGIQKQILKCGLLDSAETRKISTSILRERWVQTNQDKTKITASSNPNIVLVEDCFIKKHLKNESRLDQLFISFFTGM